jgi:hypothetical protein
MKRTITTLTLTAALLLTIGVGSSFARSTNNGGGGDNANAWFHKDFQKAELLDTRSGEDFTRYTFKMDGIVLTAYYSLKGELMAVTHNITSTQLPLPLLLQVKRNYANYWISDLFELNANGESNYYITLESADKKVTLRSSDYNWEVFSKTAKD